METKRADHLGWLDKLADGAIVWDTSCQAKWFYVRAVRDGKFIRRRYLRTQQVQIQEDNFS